MPSGSVMLNILGVPIEQPPVIPPSFFDTIKVFWDSLSMIEKILVVTGVSGSVILIVSSGGRREQPIVIVTGGKKE